MKIENKKVFFGDNGLTSTSANFIANKAKEMVENLKINNLSFVTTKVKPLNSDEITVISNGYAGDLNFENILNEIAELHALEAWLREGIKAKTEYTNQISYYDFDDWAKNNGITVPVLPRRNEVDNDDYFATISEYDLVNHYRNEAYASVIGKFVHPKGILDIAREGLKKKIENPTQLIDGTNTDYLYIYEPSVDSQEVENIYFALQDKHREYQAQVNKDVYDKEQWERNKNVEYSNEYREAYLKYNNELQKLYEDFRMWKDAELKKVQDMKIVIPKSLKKIYDEVNKK